MSKNPIINSLGALGYISLVATIMTYIEGNPPHSKSIIGPIAFISMLTLSAAVMGYIFLSNPVQLYLDGKKKEAVKLFVQTLLSFAVITAIIFTLFLSGVVGG